MLISKLMLSRKPVTVFVFWSDNVRWHTNMSHVTQNIILQVKIKNMLARTKGFIFINKIRISFNQSGQTVRHMSTRIKNGGKCCKWWSAQAIYHPICTSLLVFDDQMELLQIGGPLLMSLISPLALGQCEWLSLCPRCSVSIVYMLGLQHKAASPMWGTFGLHHWMFRCDMQQCAHAVWQQSPRAYSDASIIN